MPNSSIVLALGVAVNATKVMPPSSARAAICAARMSSVLTSPPSLSSFSSSADSTAFSLAAASPVCELCASSAITAKRLPCVAASSRTASRANGKVWIVQTTIFLSPESAVGQLAALAAALALDRRHHAGGALEIEDRFLQLRVDHVAVGHDQHGIEQLLVLRVVQVGQEVRGPGDGVGLARARRMLDQVLAARPFVQHGGLELARGVELVEAGEDDLLDLLLLVLLGDQVAAEDFEPAFPLPDLFPQVGGAMPAVRVHAGCRPPPSSPWLNGRNTVAGAVQLGRHVHFAVADGEMHQRPAGEGQQRLGGLALGLGMAVEAILVDRVADALREVGLQLGRRHRQAVEEQHQVDAVLVVQRVAHLPHDAQPVGGVAGQDVGVDGQGGLELRQRQLLSQAQHLDAVPQHIERAALVELIAQAGQQGFGGVRAVVLGEGVPGLGLRGLHPGQHVLGEQGPRPVVLGRVAFGVQPAVGGEVLADLGLEVDFLVQAHAASASANPRTSILPVTAAEIRAVRRSCSRSMARWASAVR